MLGALDELIGRRLERERLVEMERAAASSRRTPSFSAWKSVRRGRCGYDCHRKRSITISSAAASGAAGIRSSPPPPRRRRSPILRGRARVCAAAAETRRRPFLYSCLCRISAAAAARAEAAAAASAAADLPLRRRVPPKPPPPGPSRRRAEARPPPAATAAVILRPPHAAAASTALGRNAASSTSARRLVLRSTKFIMFRRPLRPSAVLRRAQRLGAFGGHRLARGGDSARVTRSLNNGAVHKKKGPPLRVEPLRFQPLRPPAMRPTPCVAVAGASYGASCRPAESVPIHRCAPPPPSRLRHLAAAPPLTSALRAKLRLRDDAAERAGVADAAARPCPLHAGGGGGGRRLGATSGRRLGRAARAAAVRQGRLPCGVRAGG